MKIPRFIHYIYAHAMAYYWLPCPICWRMYGGHENDGGTLWDSRYSGRGVCPNCTDEANRRNAEFFDKLPPEVMELRG